MKRFTLIFLATITFSLVYTQVYVYDESYKDPSFLSFKLKLVKAITEKDTSQLFPLLLTK